MVQIISHKNTLLENQFGAEITLLIHGVKRVLRVFCCTEDGAKVKASVDGSKSINLDVTVTESNHCQPKVSVWDDQRVAHIRFSDVQVEVDLQRLGLLADVYDLKKGSQDMMDISSCLYDELAVA